MASAPYVRMEIALEPRCAQRSRGANGIGRNYVEYNEICHVCLEIADTGADWPPRRPGNAHIAGMFRGNRFVRNIVCSRRAEAYPMFFYGWAEVQIERSDYNLFFLPQAPGYRVSWIVDSTPLEGNTFDRWREPGFDEHSIVADPRFARLDFDRREQEAFCFAPDSPAWSLGFQPIDLSQIGIRPE